MIGKKIAFLVILALFAFIVGLFGFKMGYDARGNEQLAAQAPPPPPREEQTAAPASQPSSPAIEANLNIVGDMKTTLREITGLKGDPNSDETRIFLERLAANRDNLARLEQEVLRDRTDEKYKGQADRIISALRQEQAILQDVEFVLKNPSDAAAQDAINRVNSQVSSLISGTAGMKLNSVDLGYAFQLDDLASGLGVYISRKRALDDAKRAEDERNAIREREGR